MGCEGRALEWCYSPSQPGTSTFLFFFRGIRVFVEAILFGIREIGPFEVRAKLWCHSPKLRVKKGFLSKYYISLSLSPPTYYWWKGVGSFANSFIVGSPTEGWGGRGSLYPYPGWNRLVVNPCMSTEEQYGNFCINVYCLLQASKKTSNLPEPEAAKPTFWALTSLSPLLGRSGLLLLGCLYIGERNYLSR